MQSAGYCFITTNNNKRMDERKVMMVRDNGTNGSRPRAIKVGEARMTKEGGGEPGNWDRTDINTSTSEEQ